MSLTAKGRLARAALTACGALLAAAGVQAEGLLKNLAWTAYDVGSSGY